MREQGKGRIMIIGGNEDKEGDCLILRRFISLAGGTSARIALLTTATEFPREVGATYQELFLGLGADQVDIVMIPDRQTARQTSLGSTIEAASGIFFTGGDQLRLTSILGGSTVDAAIRRAVRRGVVVAGTSAGASVMSDTMIVDGDSSDTPKKSTLTMAHGMSLVHGMVIDQHFAQRGRINRLLAAVAQNPKVLGVGIDEDTALIVAPDGQCEVVGSQTVTVLDGQQIVHSNISDSGRNEPLALTQVMLHILPAGFGFHVGERVPFLVSDEEAGSQEKRSEAACNS